jgi:hypothetical protein
MTSAEKIEQVLADFEPRPARWSGTAFWGEMIRTKARLRPGVPRHCPLSWLAQTEPARLSRPPRNSA